jgi:hypothetical protein
MPGKHSWYSNLATNWMVQGSNPNMSKRFIPSSKHPDQLWGVLSLITEYWRQSERDVKHHTCNSLPRPYAFLA